MATLRAFSGLGGLLFLSACSSDADMIELQEYVRTVVNRLPGTVEPPPEVLAYAAFTYSAASLRGPFDVPMESASAIRSLPADEVKPDESRPREYLENFAVDSLVLVGTLARAGVNWALVRDAGNSVNRVAVGNYMGRNHGRIVAISAAQIDFVEIVPTGDGGWMERPQSMVLE